MVLLNISANQAAQQTVPAEFSMCDGGLKVCATFKTFLMHFF